LERARRRRADHYRAAFRAARSTRTLGHQKEAKLSAAFLVLVLQTASPTTCSCDEDWSPFEQQVRSAFQAADYIAWVDVSSVASVVETREENWAVVNSETGQSEDKILMVNKQLLVAQFNPLRIWKGDQSANSVEVALQSQTCGFTLRAGAQYLIYAYGPDDNGRIETGRCMRTALVEKSSKDIAILDELVKPAPANTQYSKSEERFRDALELIHAYSGAGDELSRAKRAAESLLQSDPGSGFSQTLEAEALSTYALGQDGEPVELRTRIIELADEALRLNSRLAQAHVAKARAYVRASLILDAEAEIAKALAIDPRLESAIFQQAEIYRRSGDIARGEEWYLNFITATKSPTRKSNGYYWMGKMYNDVAYSQEGQRREMYLKMTRYSYQRMVDLDPNGAWKLVNFAIFLNGIVADFNAAELYAQKALSVMEFPMARYHLAAARYQKLQLKAAEMDGASLQASIAQIAASTRVSLPQAISFRSFSPVIVSRLSELQSRSIN
jgi:tetratricopeptide (TPR) repeat protein